MRRSMTLSAAVWLIVVSFILAVPCERATAEGPLASGLDPANFDRNVRPQDDLFRAVNGDWLANMKIPADRPSYGAFAGLGEKSEKDLHAIIEDCAKAQGNAAGSEEQKIGDLYASYMDEARAEQLGIEPLRPTLAAIDRIETKADLIRTMAELERVGVPGPVGFHVQNDAKQSDRNILYMGQAGLGLPDRDYYWDAKLKDKLAAYTAHVERMLTLAGMPNSKQAAADIVAFETRLAKAHWSKIDNRDSTKTYNKKTRDELVKLAPGLDWNLYLDALGAKDARELIVAQPSYATALAAMTDSVPLGTWKAWMKWNAIRAYAGLLNREMADASFDFYGRTLFGIPQQRPRWKRAVGAVEGALSEAVGKLYVAKHFPPEAKERMDRMVANILSAYRHAFEKNDWMSPETKRKALAKLATFRPKIGYPTKWRDYSALEIRRDDLVGNMRRAAAFEWNRDLAKLNSPVDREEWHMPPQMVNAYYNPNMNEIVFPAAILQPPFFNLKADEAVNYGGIGSVIAHEIGHGFDDQGSKWDGAGNLVNWWTPADRAEFDRRGAILAEQYGQFEPLPGFKVNGRFTLGENIADLCGLTISQAAYRASLGGKEAPVIDGLTGDQRFFMGFAQVWRNKCRDDDLKNRLVTDPHSPAEFRANGTPRNVEAFYSAFGVRPGDKMYLPPEKRVKIW